LKQVTDSPNLFAAVRSSKELIVSYAGLLLIAGVVPQSPEAETRGPLQLVDSIDAQFKGPVAGAVALPAGFLEEFCAKHETEGLDQIMRPVVKEYSRRVRATSPLGDYVTPLSVIRFLTGIEPLARVLVSVREWLPDLKDVTGRGIESPGSSWLGPCFSVSCIPDHVIASTPSVVASCFSNFESRRQGDIVNSMNALRMAARQIQGELHTIIKALLGKSTRDAMVGWLAAVLEGNGERAKMHMDPDRAASHGFFVNLDAVLLKLCGPFMDPSNANFWKRVDARYVTASPRISFAGETRLAMNAEEETAWRERVLSSLSSSTSAGSPPEFHFICECFFMTAKALHLGVVKIMNERIEVAQSLGHMERQVVQVEAMLPSLAGMPQERQYQRYVTETRLAIKAEQDKALAVETVLGDADFMGEVLAFYRLLSSFMLCTACPPCGGNASAVQLPLPEPPPQEFASLPEYFVEDMADVLLYVSRAYPHLLQNAKMDELMLFLVVFMGSPAYVRSSHLRSRLSEVLHVWLPSSNTQGGWRASMRSQLGSSLSYLFAGHPTVVSQLVPTLLRLYVDVEFTDRHNQFYMKFQSRQALADILRYLWEQPQHKEVWHAYAAREGSGSGGYVRFANMLITDAIFLLDESLKKLQEVKEKETLMADEARWAALPEQERRETQSSLSTTGDQLRSLITLAQGTISTMSFTTAEITGPFLLPEMVERVAAALDYFLKYLTGSERRKLAIREPDKYNFKPRELLLSLIQVYLNLAAADRPGALARAIAADERSYSPQMFPEAAKVLGAAGLLPPPQAAQLEVLARRVEEAVAAVKEQEDLLQDAEVPSDFQDPIMMTLMTDPVLLPTSNLVCDRSQIVRHLLSDQRDPINRKPLTPDMLQPQPELKARIQAWIAETIAEKKRQRAGAMQE